MAANNLARLSHAKSLAHDEATSRDVGQRIAVQRIVVL